jgi:hypothetical protein
MQLNYPSDTRNVATTPNDYNSVFKNVALKAVGTIGLTGITSTSSYAYVLGYRGWTDVSGGNSHELAFTNDGIFTR